MGDLTVVKILNNNLLLVSNEGQDIILTGKGIGFGKKIGEPIDLNAIKFDGQFLKLKEEKKEKYLNFISQTDSNILEIASELIIEASKGLGPLNSRIYIVLADHISLALERMKLGMDIENPFLSEIKVIYSKEFEIAKMAYYSIKERMGIEINEDEIGFIALHLYSASEGTDVKHVVKHTRVINTLVEIIETELKIKVPKDLTFTRLINHLRGTLARVEKRKEFDDGVASVLKEQFKEGYEIALKCGAYIKNELGLDVNEEELSYMALHIERLKRLV
jgi:transcriptional antiterminator